MSLTFQIFVAFILDMILGDPHGYPHPVKIIAKLATRIESFSRSRIHNQQIAGLLTTSSVVLFCFGSTYLIISLLTMLHPLAGDLGSIFFIYTSLSIRNLFDESRPIFSFLKKEQLSEARKTLANIVGRDTQNLKEEEVVRATVETVAESTVDGIIAPLFYAVLGGAPLVITYKAISTMDSLFGYKNKKYIEFGWASARLDDFANWLPARLAIPIISMSAPLCGLNGRRAWAIAWRDGRKHPSPNAGIPEAAMAGALGIQLGGTSYYSGIENAKPLLGDACQEIESPDIIQSQKLMFASAFLTLAVFLAYGNFQIN